MNTAEITSPQEMQSQLESILAGIVPGLELKLKAGLAAEINRLKREKNAVILGHNYMEPALFNSSRTKTPIPWCSSGHLHQYLC